MGVTVSVVSGRLLADLSRILEPLGFKTNRSRRTFTRRVDNFDQQIQAILNNYPGGGVTVEIRISIHSNEVKEIYRRIQLASRPYHVLSTDLPRIVRYYDQGSSIPSEQSWYLAHSDISLTTLLNALGTYIRDYALRYFHENSSIGRMDALLNERPRDLTIHNWLFPVRAQMGLITAKLSKRQDYPALVATYSEQMTGAVEPYKSEFELIKTELANERAV